MKEKRPAKAHIVESYREMLAPAAKRRVGKREVKGAGKRKR